ncbi:MAG: hypothetical protein PVG78_03160 [Desulfobacterales bacterium]
MKIEKRPRIQRCALEKFFSFLRSFSLLAQRKGTEKKRRPASRFSLRFSKPAGPSRTRPPKNGDLRQLEGLIRLFLAMLSAGRWVLSHQLFFSPFYKLHRRNFESSSEKGAGFYLSLRDTPSIAEAGDQGAVAV